ncbi:cell division protein ZapA [bacterium]|nr:cell division protein ZapA [bacterium]MBU3955979.1 cell division protein ZapA [bacterium]MBU4134265.1 cell division protein ZapA [bacterium]
MSTAVTLLGNKLVISDDEISPEMIVEAVKYIEKQMRALHASGNTQDTLKLAALTMIQITIEMLELKKKGYSQTEGYSKVLEEMAVKLEKEISV